MSWFKNLIAAAVGAATAAVATLQMQAQKIDDAVDKWRNANLAAFVDTCPHQRASVSVADYRRAWDRKASFDMIVAAFAANHGITKEQAAECFTNPKGTT